MSGVLVPGRDYPATEEEALGRFAEPEACVAFLDDLRWGDGFTCPTCGHRERWIMSDGRSVCTSCDHQVSVTAGTVFEKTRTPLPTWFQVAWLMTSRRHGVTATEVKRTLGLGSYQTSWSMLHRLRSAMQRAGRVKLVGHVEVAESPLEEVWPTRTADGPEDGGRIAIAAEITPGELEAGRVRMAPLEAEGSRPLSRFVREAVSPMSEVVEPAGAGPAGTGPALATAGGVTPIPVTRRIAALARDWLLSSHKGGAREQHVSAYLDEFVFRFNLRTAPHAGHRFRRLLEHAVRTPPTTYRELVSGS